MSYRKKTPQETYKQTRQAFIRFIKCYNEKKLQNYVFVSDNQIKRLYEIWKKNENLTINQLFFLLYPTHILSKL